MYDKNKRKEKGEKEKVVGQVKAKSYEVWLGLDLIELMILDLASRFPPWTSDACLEKTLVWHRRPLFFLFFFLVFAPCPIISLINPLTSLSFQLVLIFFLLLFVLFEVIYEVWILFWVHPHLFFFFGKFGFYFFNL